MLKVQTLVPYTTGAIVLSVLCSSAGLAQSTTPGRTVANPAVSRQGNTEVMAAKLRSLESLSLTTERLQQLASTARELPQDMHAWVSGRAEALAKERRVPGRAALDREIVTAFPKAPQEQRTKLALALIQWTMGDLAEALQGVTRQIYRNDEVFNRQIAQRLDPVYEARSRVMRSFARANPPRTNAGTAPVQAGRAQDQSGRYTQPAQISEPLMSALLQTEREIMDALQAARREREELLKVIEGIRDEQYRANERILKNIGR